MRYHQNKNFIALLKLKTLLVILLMDIEIVSQEPVSTKRAIHNLKKFIQDPFFEENDPEMLKSINLIYQNLLVSSYEISCPDIPKDKEEEKNEKKSEGEKSQKEEEEEEEEK